MAFPGVKITTLRNGSTAISGYRDDLSAGDTIVASLTSTLGVSTFQWQLVGRPEGSSAGGAGPEPINLGSASTASFTVDDDGPFRRDGTYVLQCTVNAGTPTQTVIRALVARLSGITISGGRTLRKMGGLEALPDDTSIANTEQGWATQLLRWFEYLRSITVGSSTPTHTYALPALEDSSGAEVAQPQSQIVVNFNDFGGTVGVALAGTGFSQSGTATVKVRVGGSDGAADGTSVLSLSVPAGTAISSAAGAFANPTGTKRVILTIESSGSSESAIMRDITLVFQ